MPAPLHSSNSCHWFNTSCAASIQLTALHATKIALSFADEETEAQGGWITILRSPCMQEVKTGFNPDLSSDHNSYDP